MRTKSIGIWLFGLAGAVALSVLLSRGSALAREKTELAAARWEYKIVLLEGGADNDPRVNQANFDKLGMDGWELTGLDASHRPYFCVFKRQRP